MPLISPLVKCAVVLLGKKKKRANMPSSTWTLKTLLHNLSVLKSIWQPKLDHCFHVLFPLSASILNFISYLDCQCFGAGAAISVSLWSTLLSGSRPGLKKRSTCLHLPFTIIMQIHDPKADYLQGPCAPNWKGPFLLAFQQGLQHLIGPFPGEWGRDPECVGSPLYCFIL